MSNSGSSVADERTGPGVPKSTVLTVEQEAIILTLRRLHSCSDHALPGPASEGFIPQFARAAALPTGFAARAGAEANHATTFNLEHPLGPITMRRGLPL